MKKIKLLLVLLLILCLYTLYAQEADQPKTAAVTSEQGDKIAGLYFPRESSKQKLELVLVDDFENCDSWHALMPSDQGFARAKKVLGSPTDVKKDYPNRSSYVLGIKEWSYSRGFNWAELTPPQPIPVVGKLKGLSIWACGRNYRHNLEIWVKNYQGIEYPIDMGSLNFRGWKKLSARIPMYIPYYTKYIPQYKTMHITRILIRHDPNEKNGSFYCYIDNLEAIVDTYEDIYDGNDMINEMGMERWEETQQGDVQKMESKPATTTTEPAGPGGQ